MSKANEVQSEARLTTDEVLKRDRRRIRMLAVLTIGLWVLAALLIPAVYLPLGAKLKVFAKMLDEANPGAANALLRNVDTPSKLPPPTPEEVPAVLNQVRHQTWIVSQIVFHEWIVGAVILAFALATGFLASISTVALAITIRRVTLRQVNDSLAEISDQLRRLQAPSA